MRYMTRKLKILCLGVVLIGVVCVGTVAYQNIQYHAVVSEALSPIEQVTGWLKESKGNLYGNIYSLDGIPMLKCLNLQTGENIKGKSTDNVVKLYCSTEKFFAPVTGYKYCAENIQDSLSSGMLSEPEVEKILLANNAYKNQVNIQGDDIVTTIYSLAQEEAVNQLEDLGGQAEIAVVNADGAILVNASAVPLNQVEFQNDTNDYIKNSKEEPAYYTTNYNAFKSAAVGSSFKPLTARVLQQNDKFLSKSWSIYNSEFDDTSTVIIDGLRVNNWELISPNVKPENYYTSYDGTSYHRKSDLETAFINSSNTYFLRHANELGLDKFQELLNDNLHLYDQYAIGGFKLEGLQKYEQGKFQSKEAYNINLPFGNTAYLSPVRLASSYNHALSGHFYLPFEIAEIREPGSDGNIIFQYQPEEQKEYKLDIDIKNDIVIEGLKATFQSYVSDSNGKYYDSFEDFSNKLLASERILSKSGTAGVDSEHENRTMALTLLNEDKNSVICTAVIAVNNVQKNSITNVTLIYKLLKVLETLEVLN